MIVFCYMGLVVLVKQNWRNVWHTNYRHILTAYFGLILQN